MHIDTRTGWEQTCRASFPAKAASGKAQNGFYSLRRKITPSGQVKTFATGLTTVLGLAFDHIGRLYVLENTTGNPGPTPGTGKVVRIEHSGKVTEIATGLSVPTAMTFGPDGNLYVSNIGFGASPIGLGQVVRIQVPQ